MGANLAFRNADDSELELRHFNSRIVAKLILPAGKWVVTGRAVIVNFDGDPQSGSARIIHQANVVIDTVTLWLLPAVRSMVYLQTLLLVEEQDVVTLNCDTYSGSAQFASLLAFDVDEFGDG